MILRWEGNFELWYMVRWSISMFSSANRKCSVKVTIFTDVTLHPHANTGSWSRHRCLQLYFLAFSQVYANIQLRSSDPDHHGHSQVLVFFQCKLLPVTCTLYKIVKLFFHIVAALSCCQQQNLETKNIVLRVVYQAKIYCSNVVISHEKNLTFAFSIV